jgi:hypothetical protein
MGDDGREQEGRDGERWWEVGVRSRGVGGVEQFLGFGFEIRWVGAAVCCSGGRDGRRHPLP